MEYWWKENRTFVAPLAVGLVVVFGWYVFWIGRVREQAQVAERARQVQETNLAALMANGVPSEDAVQRARRDLERTTKNMGDVHEGLGLRVPDPLDPKKLIAFSAEAYKPPGGKGVHEYFQAQHVEVAKRLQEMASSAGVGMPDSALGFPPGLDDVSDAVGLEILARLAIVDRLVTSAVQAGVSKIGVIEACVNGEAREVVVKSGAFLSRLTVRMKVVGSSTSIFEWLHSVQKRGEYLAVDNFSATKESQHEDAFAAEMEVSGLLINPKGELVQDAKP